MKKTIILAAATVCLAACQESLEDRAAREAQEFTRKNCPVQVTEVLTNDSLAFDRQTLTLHYFYTLSGAADTTAIQQTDLRSDMVKQLKGTTSVRPFKEAGYNFMYTFHSAKNKGKVLYEVNITKKDYNN